MNWKVVILALIIVALAAPSSAYVIVRKDGTRFEAVAPPEYLNGKAIFTLKGGSKGSMPEELVNKEATERANRPEATTTEPKTEGGAKSESLGSKAPGGKAKNVFTNEDLSKAEGRSTVEGSVTAEGTPDSVESQEDWAKRHDEEMAQLEKERLGTTGQAKPGPAKPAPGTEEAPPPPALSPEEAKAADAERAARDRAAAGQPPPEEAPKEETEEERLARLEKQVADLRTQLDKTDKTIGGGAGDAATVNARLSTADELTKAEKELAEAKGEGEEE